MKNSYVANDKRQPADSLAQQIRKRRASVKNSNRLAILIRSSVAPDEDPADFNCIIKTTLSMYESMDVRSRHAIITRQRVIQPFLWFLCVMIKPKPPRYKQAIHEFRLAFAGISEDKTLQNIFRSSIKPALFRTTRLRLAAPIPSLYFDWDKARKMAAANHVQLNELKYWY